jgi:hypothetical protein
MIETGNSEDARKQDQWKKCEMFSKESMNSKLISNGSTIINFSSPLMKRLGSLY